VFAISANGRNERQLTNTRESEGNLAWTASGKQILFSIFKDDTDHLYGIDPDGKNEHELASVPGRAPTLSPDAKRLVYLAGTWTATRLMVSALDGTNAKQITDDASIAWNNHWSPVGKLIAFTGRNDPKGELAVFVMTRDGHFLLASHLSVKPSVVNSPISLPSFSIPLMAIDSCFLKSSVKLNLPSTHLPSRIVPAPV